MFSVLVNLLFTVLFHVRYEGWFILSIRILQGFDGASVMSGIYGGVQAIIRGRTTNPVPFVHCSTHNLCLVIKDVVVATNHTSDFFDCLGQVSG